MKLRFCVVQHVNCNMLEGGLDANTRQCTGQALEFVFVCVPSVLAVCS
jgi:hypothetical protein